MARRKQPAMARLVVPTLVLGAVVSLPAWAETPVPTSQGSVPRRVEPADLPVTRADLAAAYLRFEELWRRYPPVVSRLRELNRLFDGVAYRVIRNDFRGALRMLNDLADSLLPEGRASDQARLLRSLRLRVTPGVIRLDAPAPLVATITPFYPVDVAGEVSARLVLRPADANAPVVEWPVRIRPDDPSRTQPLTVPSQPGRYFVQLVSEDGSTGSAATLFVVSGSLDALRERNERAASALDGNGPLRQAIYAFRARNRLLTDRVFEGDSSSFLANRIALAEELAVELAALQAGSDPYVGRIGDYWRAFLAGATGVPVRIYAPPAVASRRPLPVVIALHGLGGDENMFMEGLGAGSLRRLAEELGFLLVTPSTYSVLPNPLAFDTLLESIAALYPVDRSRVYVIGHSMGAMVAGSWASLHRDRLAAACLIAGGQIFGESSAPALLVAGEFDSLFKVERLQALAEGARRRGLPVEFRVMLNYGHVLLVGDILPEATRWLLAHRLAGVTTRPTTEPAER